MLKEENLNRIINFHDVMIIHDVTLGYVIYVHSITGLAESNS